MTHPLAEGTPVTRVRIKILPVRPHKRYPFTVAVADVEFGEMYVARGVALRQVSPGLQELRFPSRAQKFDCKWCFSLNPFDAKFCNDCGGPLTPIPAEDLGHDGRVYHLMPVAEGATEILRDLIRHAYLDLVRRRKEYGDVSFFATDRIVNLSESA